MSRSGLPIRPLPQWKHLLVLSLGACIGPSDTSGEVFVTIEAPTHVVIQGRGILLQARAWRQVPEGRLEALPGISYRWRASSEGIVSLADSGSRATVIGVATGLDSVYAVPVDFEEATPGAWGVRVASSVEIDQVSPATVRYGEQITVTGVGLGRAIRFALGEANLIPDPGSFSGDSAGLGTLRLWVPFPARSDQLLAVTPEGTSSAAADSTTVVPLDAFEPNDDVPSLLRLDPGAGDPSGPLFLNPALALEPGGTDRYRIQTGDAGRALTILVSDESPLVATFEVDLFVGGEPWRIGIREQECRDSLVAVEDIVPEPVVRAFTGLPGGNLELVVRGPPSRYDLRVLDGYRLQNPAIGPDRFEDNDYCIAADDALKRIDLSSPFSDTLTIDNGYELDWYRFVLPGPGTQLVTIRTASRPLTAVDSSDVALFLLTAPQPQTTPLAQSDVPGSAEVLSLELEPGEYYLLVADRGGVATRYALCLARGSSCPLAADVAGMQSMPTARQSP